MTTSVASAEPMEGDTLIRITVEPCHVAFEFTTVTLEISSRFELKQDNELQGIFLPERKEGNLSLLWPLMEQTVSSVSWREQITITFESGQSIEIAPGFHRGTLIGKVQPNCFEDF